MFLFSATAGGIIFLGFINFWKKVTQNESLLPKEKTKALNPIIYFIREAEFVLLNIPLSHWQSSLFALIALQFSPQPGTFTLVLVSVPVFQWWCHHCPHAPSPGPQEAAGWGWRPQHRRDGSLFPSSSGERELIGREKGLLRGCFTPALTENLWEYLIPAGGNGLCWMERAQTWSRNKILSPTNFSKQENISTELLGITTGEVLFLQLYI